MQYCTARTHYISIFCILYFRSLLVIFSVIVRCTLYYIALLLFLFFSDLKSVKLIFFQLLNISLFFLKHQWAMNLSRIQQKTWTTNHATQESTLRKIISGRIYWVQLVLLCYAMLWYAKHLYRISYFTALTLHIVKRWIWYGKV